MKIWIIGLGSGDPDRLSLGNYRLLNSGLPVWLRTEQHPTVSWLREQGIKMMSFDTIYEQHSTFSKVYEMIVQALIEQVQQHGEIVYAVPGHPLVAEQTVKELLEKAKSGAFAVEIKGSESFLDTAFASLQIDPIDGFALLNGDELQVAQLQPNVHQLIGQVYDRHVASEVKLTLMEIYPEDTPITLICSMGIEGAESQTVVPLSELDHRDDFHNLTSLYIAPQSERWCLTRRFETIVALFAHLRSPEGCPWDRKQTHRSLRPYLLEEAYEFLTAVDEDDFTAMEEELGDLLLQVLLHAQIANEAGHFDIGDVIQGLCEKMIRRHPHVFSTTKEQTVSSWDHIKQVEKGKTPESLLEDVIAGMPSLIVAHAMQQKASKVGFDWESMSEVEKKVMEEWKELQAATTPSEQEEEFGDLLFTLVNLARFLEVNPEVALHRVNQKFRKRFKQIERHAREAGIALQEATLTQMDQWWEEAKSEE